MKGLRTLCLLSIVMILSPQSLFSQSIYEKDWKTWSLKEVYKIVNESPWVKSFNNIEVSFSYTDINRGGFDAGGQLGPAPPILVRLYSSLKLRQALLRLKQLQNNYDTMDDKQKLVFDNATVGSLDCPDCDKYYIFIMLQPVDKPSSKSLIYYAFKDDDVDEFKGKIFLTNDTNERRELERFAAPKSTNDPAVFYFPKMDANQKSLVTSSTKKITVQFKPSLLRGKAFLNNVEFNLPKMLIDGKLDFD